MEYVMENGICHVKRNDGKRNNEVMEQGKWNNEIMK